MSVVSSRLSRASSIRSLFYRVLALNLFVLVGTILISTHFQQLKHQFKDGGFIDIFSGIQIFVIAYLAFRVFQMRSRGRRRSWKSPTAIWGIISIGFFLLGLDEIAAIHETLDTTIHSILQLQETGLSDRLDDLIVCIYVLVSIALLIAYRREVKRYRAAFPYVLSGFVLLFFMVIIDALTNRIDVLLLLFSPETSMNVMSWIFIPEDGCKLISETCFVTAGKACLKPLQGIDKI